jgi:thiamine biosynthesis lipoprotein
MSMTRIVVALALAWLLGACSAPPPYRQQAYVFGTLVEVSVYGVPAAQAEAAVGAVLARFDALHRKLHAWQPSALTDINRAFAAGRKAPVDDELAAIIRDATAISEQSGGTFNPAIGKLIALWGFQADTPPGRVPDAAAIARLVRAAPRMRDVHIADGRIWSDNPDVRLDLGGYAKGYALDEAVRVLRAHGVADALVNIGGNIIALGRHGERPWRVAIQHPRRPGPLATVDLLDGEAIGTSGDYQRYFEADGRRYCHLIDPRSGHPASGMQSVTVLVAGERAGTRSDALSKPLFIEGPERLAVTAGRMGVTRYLAIDAAGRQYVSADFRARLR